MDCKDGIHRQYIKTKYKDSMLVNFYYINSVQGLLLEETVWKMQYH